MQFLFLLPLFILNLFSCAPKENSASAVKSAPYHSVSFYDFTLNSIDGQPINFMRYKGKKVMLVNVASKCGFTKQYAELQKLHEKHGDKLVILGFPANNFGGQEPGSNEEIAEFCQKNFGVDFQMMEKISVTGNDAHALYQWLSDPHLNGWNSEKPGWNFCKYLVDEKGKLVKYWPSKISPLSEEVLAAVK